VTLNRSGELAFAATQFLYFVVNFVDLEPPSNVSTKFTTK